MTELSDDLLVAYVDGQLARKQSRVVDKVLAQDDVIARRVDALRHAHGRLEAAFAAILAGEELAVSAKSAPERPGIFVPWHIAAKVGLAVTGVVAAALIAVYAWSLIGARHAGPQADAPIPPLTEPVVKAR